MTNKNEAGSEPKAEDGERINLGEIDMFMDFSGFTEKQLEDIIYDAESIFKKAKKVLEIKKNEEAERIRTEI